MSSKRAAESPGPERATAPGYPPRIGLTGSIGAGKSSVAQRLADKGAVVLDADAYARQATQDPEVLRRIAMELGEHYLQGGSLDRAALAERVFGDEQARRVLEGIIHPWVRQAAAADEAAAVARSPQPPLVVHDVPLLFETGLHRRMDATLLVTAPLVDRVRRLHERSGMSEEAVLARDASQMPESEKLLRADFVIRNDGRKEDLDALVDELWPRLLGVSPAGGQVD